MKVVILSGGRGFFDPVSGKRIPKGMMMIGDRPLLWHVMKCFATYGHNEFIVALGEGGNEIRKYFLEQAAYSQDIEISNSSGKINYLNQTREEDWTIKLINTGINAMTGARISRCKKYLDGETFFISYSDCLSDVNLNNLIKSHNMNKKIVTITGVQPPTRFGTFYCSTDEKVVDYSLGERLIGKNGFINGGFMIAEHSLFDYLTPYNECNLEDEIFKNLAIEGKVKIQPHTGYWQAVDTERDLLILNNMYEQNKRPWLPKPNDLH